MVKDKTLKDQPIIYSREVIKGKGIRNPIKFRIIRLQDWLVQSLNSFLTVHPGILWEITA